MIDKLKEGISSYKLPIAFTLIGVVLLSGGVSTSFSQITPKSLTLEELPKASLVSAENITKDITIDISGAVKIPGVYRFEKDSRVEDAIRQAGGFTDQVHKQFVSKSLNLATKLSDGQKIYIPFEGEIASVAPAAVLAAVSISGSNQISRTGEVINLNSGTQSQLESLTGVGPVTASKIINGRPYNTVGELLSKKIVSKSVYEKIKAEVGI
jgi:competence protein ComEA